MTPRELKFQQQYADIVREFEASFPSIDHPHSSWLHIWLRDYHFQAVWEAIQTLRNHPPHIKVRFTQESVGKAISALLRQEALKRAIASVQKPGGRS